MLALTFQIQLDSNYHIGAGYGKGFNIDSALLREADGTLVLRGTTMMGLLRDGAFRLLRLKPLASHKPEEILERLFGSSTHAKSWHISSARPTVKCTEDSKAIQRVRIDPLMRRAEEGKLFSQEEGLGEQGFFFSLTCPCRDKIALEMVLDEAALMVASARNVRQLGRSRRRGLGECTINLANVETNIAGASNVINHEGQTWQDWLLERFDRAWMKGCLKDRKSAEIIIPSDIQSIEIRSDSPVRMRMIVRLDEPLLIAQRASAGNHYDTRSFIPGSVIMGAFAGMVAENCELNIAANYSDFINMFLRDGIKFSMFYPGDYHHGNLYPSIPAPLGLLTCSIVPLKGESEGHGTYSAIDHDKCQHSKCKSHKSRLEPIDGFLILQKEPHVFNILRTSELHIRIDETTQRAAKRALYSYSVISDGQFFIGEMICSDETIWERLKEMTGFAENVPQKCRLGKARSRGYGQVTLWLERCDEHLQTWIQIPIDQRIADKSDKSQIISITLLSDTIIQNSWGQQAVGFEPNWMKSALGLGNVEVLDSYARTRIVDGFNSTLGLPRWRDTALVAGSMAWIRLRDSPENWAEQMQRLELEGIGLRRHEGFGRIAFNHPIFNQHQKLAESSICLDRVMKPRSRISPDRVMEEWEDQLDKFLSKKKFSGASFQALARWLHTHSNKSINELINTLSSFAADPAKASFGQPDRVLIDEIGEVDYGKRDKKNFFIDKGKEEIKAIIKALEYLKKEDPKYWRRCIERLAEWIELASIDERKGGIQ